MRFDSDIRQDVENELEWSPNIEATDIAVKVKEGTVELTGYVKRYSERVDAEAAAKRVTGVAGVANDIEVRIPDFDKRPDPDVARDAVSHINNSSVKPTVDDGWVKLEGNVEWNYQKKDIELAVAALKGVKGVTNLIDVKPRFKATEVKNRIEAALKRNAAIDASHITVDASGSTVTLRGSVRSWAERDEAETAAWAAPGVTHVEDQMSVHY